MNIRDLQYLVAVAKHKHFGKAAKECFVSQPALSMQLQKLEDTLGVQLFERTNKCVMITQVGQKITDRARKILRDVEELKEVAKACQDPFAGEFRLGAFPTLAPYFLPKIVPLIATEFPKLRLLLIEEKTDVLLGDLRSGKIDVAILALPIDVDSLEYTELFEDKFFLAVAPQHPLSKQQSITRNNIENESLLLLEDGHCLRDQALDVCSLVGSSERQDFRATSLETLRQMVASNVGITLMPNIARKENDGIVYIPFKSDSPSRTIAMVWRKTLAKKECLYGIVKLIQATVLI